MNETGYVTTERRHLKRVPVHWKAEFVNHTAHLLGDAETVDISLSGVRLATKRFLRIGEKIKLWLFAKEGTSPIPITGQVQWHKRLTQERWHIGVTFLEVDPHLLYNNIVATIMSG